MQYEYESDRWKHANIQKQKKETNREMIEYKIKKNTCVADNYRGLAHVSIQRRSETKVFDWELFGAKLH